MTFSGGNIFVNLADITIGTPTDGTPGTEVVLDIPTVPEPSTWAMMLIGFAGLGWLARLSKRKTSPA